MLAAVGGRERPRRRPPSSERLGRPRRPRAPPPPRLGAPRAAPRPAPAGRPRPRAARGRPRCSAGVSPGSSSRACAGRSHSASRPSSTHQLVAPAQLLGLVAVEGHVQRAERRGSRHRSRLAAASSCGERGPGGDGRPARDASSASSPQVASPTGASMPAATPEAPAPGRSRSSTRTRRPRCAARQAQARPIAPAPTTIDVDVRLSARLGTLSSSPGATGATIPAPALPGSGSDGRRPRCRPLSHAVGLPLLLLMVPRPPRE